MITFHNKLVHAMKYDCDEFKRDLFARHLITIGVKGYVEDCAKKDDGEKAAEKMVDCIRDKVKESPKEFPAANREENLCSPCHPTLGLFCFFDQKFSD